MDVFEAVRTILAVREYKDKPVPDDLVRRIVDAGRLTASAMNRQPWHFVVVRERATLGELGKVATTGPYVAQAPLAVVVAVDKSGSAIGDASRAIQSMVLTAWDAGVGSNWVGSGFDEAKRLLGVPADLDVIAIVAFGYPAQAMGRGKKQRKALGEVAHSERYGQPFE